MRAGAGLLGPAEPVQMESLLAVARQAVGLLTKAAGSAACPGRLGLATRSTGNHRCMFNTTQAYNRGEKSVAVSLNGSHKKACLVVWPAIGDANFTRSHVAGRIPTSETVPLPLNDKHLQSDQRCEPELGLGTCL